MSQINLPKYGWDLAILASVKWLEAKKQKTVLSMIDFEVVAEMGWLTNEELQSRLNDLVRKGLLRKEVKPLWSGDETLYFLTESGKQCVRYA